MNTRTIKITDIAYDTDGKKVRLPKTLTIQVAADLPQEDIEHECSEAISNQTGYCHEGFNWEYVPYGSGPIQK